MKAIPKSHPRYNSLMTRQKITDALEKGFVHKTGLIAHGRGEAFDYIFGEQTISLADDAEKAAAAVLLMAKKPVISVNGNVVALVTLSTIVISAVLAVLDNGLRSTAITFLSIFFNA